MRATHIPTVALAATLAATPALAQDSTAPQVTPPATQDLELGPRQAQAPSEPENPLNAMRAEELAGRTIFGAAGEAIGEIDQVVLDKVGNAFAVVGVGGFLGLGERDVAIPLGQLEPRPGDGLSTGLTREQVASMPAFDGVTNYLPVEGDATIREAASRAAASG